MGFKSTFKQITEQGTVYFSNINWRSTLLFLMFFVLAAIFWMMLFFQKDVEINYKIPIKYINIPEDVVFDSALPESIDTRLADKGSELLGYMLFGNDSIVIDVAEYHNNRIHNLQGTELMQLINQKLQKSSTLKTYYPVNISLNVSKLESKKVDVVFDGEITTGRTNLIPDEYEIEPRQITVYGSAEQLSEIHEVQTKHTVLSNLKATSQFEVELAPIEGLRLSPKVVDLFIPVLEYTERKFDVPVTVKNTPANLDVKFFPSNIEVSFSVTLEDYKKISEEDFAIELDYNSFYQNENGRATLELTQSPASIKNPKLSPTEIDFLLEKNN